MRIDVRFIAIVWLMLAIEILPAQAQYSEIYKLDKASNGIQEELVLNTLSEKLAVPTNTLAQEKSQHNLTFGQLYMAHALAKATNKDFDAIMSQIKSGIAFATHQRGKGRFRKGLSGSSSNSSLRNWSTISRRVRSLAAIVRRPLAPRDTFHNSLRAVIPHTDQLLLEDIA